MRLATLLVIAVSLVLAVPGLAWAYIDPGASSMAYQVLVAGALALGFALRRWWHRLGEVIGRRRSSNRDLAGPSEPNPKP
ncbi:MAG: hypothetical protein NTV05_12055 [Acidobacteria bacterium]|nr:hypothetical protein [Acidobacteriota bacterium]